MKTLRNDGLDFVCGTEAELYRARTLLTKEPGTIAWLKQLSLGDVFYDVGANVGCYTLYAARQVGDQGHVYAFEPHVGNALSLLRNVAANRFEQRVSVFTCAVGGSFDGGYEKFYYRDLVPGSSGSQIGEPRGEDGQLFTPLTVEMKSVVTLGTLVVGGVIKAPDLVKIDVDRNEFDILRGLLPGRVGLQPRGIQVETRPTNREEIMFFLQERGYTFTGRHRTSAGEHQVTIAGVHPDSITDNAVFARGAA